LTAAPKFSFDVAPPYRIEKRDGCYWVEGDGLSLAFDTAQEAREFMKLLLEDPDDALTAYLDDIYWKDNSSRSQH
jgi:hypothetical protein